MALQRWVVVKFFVADNKSCTVQVGFMRAHSEIAIAMVVARTGLRDCTVA
jgi:hypothetical protein